MFDEVVAVELTACAAGAPAARVNQFLNVLDKISVVSR
jgi:hypothetical protein